MYCRLSSGHRIRRAFFSLPIYVRLLVVCTTTTYILCMYYWLQKVSFEVFLCFNFWLNEGLVDLFVKQNSWAMLAQYSTLSKWGDFLFKGSFILSCTWGQQIFLQFFSPLSALESILRTRPMNCLWLNANKCFEVQMHNEGPNGSSMLTNCTA